MNKNISDIKVSFIVPVYNVEKYLKKCIDSILSQTHTNLEIIVIYDISNDNSYDLLKNLENQSNKIKIVLGSGNGCGAARNLGIKSASGDFILFVDSDDFIENNLLIQLLPHIVNSDVDFLNYGYDFVDLDGLVVSKKTKFSTNHLFGENILINSFLDVDINPVPWNKIYRSSFIVKNLILFPEVKEWEDVLFTRIVCFYAKSTLFISGNFYHALVRPESRSRNISLSFFEDGIKLLKLEEDFLQNLKCGDSYKIYFEAHYLKILNFFFIKSAFHMNSFHSFYDIYNFLTFNRYFEYYKITKINSLFKFKTRLMLYISQYPRILWLLAKISQRFQLINIY